MTWFEALTLAILQGVTEFLPVSSSGHLAVGSGLFRALGEIESRPDGLFFIVMLHVGTLAAILLYYRRGAWAGVLGLLDGGGVGEVPTRAVALRSIAHAAVATLPAVVVGLTLKSMVDEAFRSLMVPGVGFLVTAALLLTTSRMRDGTKGPAETTWLDALLVGLAQALAITPGISRSGTTIAAALALGFSRTWAVAFSLLMAVPAILGAAVLEVKEVDSRSIAPEAMYMTGVATVLSGVVGYGAIAWLVRIVRSGQLWYFSVYLAVLSAAVLSTAALGGRPGGPPSETEVRGATDGQGRRSEALDRPTRVGLDRSGGEGAVGGNDLDRLDATRARPPGAPASAGAGPLRPIAG